MCHLHVRLALPPVKLCSCDEGTRAALHSQIRLSVCGDCLVKEASFGTGDWSEEAEECDGARQTVRQEYLALPWNA